MITYFQTGAKRASRRAPPLQPKLTDERVQLSLEKIRVNIGDILLCLSRAQSFISPIITRHHQQVAYLSYRLCEQLEFSGEQTKDIFLAALVHDIGALSVEEQLSLIELEPVDVNNHGFRGAKLFREFAPLKPASDIIKYHHWPWNHGAGVEYLGEEVPPGSHIIHLADRTCAIFSMERNVISQVPEALEIIRQQQGTKFVPGYVDALYELSKKEYIWLDLMSNDPVDKLPDGIMGVISLEIDDIIELARVFSQVIDFRSKFTARHSAGVAKTAERLAELIGFSPNECKMMLVAGYLHDLGKLAISNEILEKPAKLDPDEFNEIRSHPYYTYEILDLIPQFKEIKSWAAYHHEKLDGTGYPFHLTGEGLPLGSRIMAVADVFTAITENRPYRKGMEDEHAIKVLKNMAAGEALDKKTVDLLISNYTEINNLRQYAQQEAGKYYEQFFTERP